MGRFSKKPDEVPFELPLSSTNGLKSCPGEFLMVTDFIKRLEKRTNKIKTVDNSKADRKLFVDLVKKMQLPKT